MRRRVFLFAFVLMWSWMIPGNAPAGDENSLNTAVEAYRAKVRKRPTDLRLHRTLIAQAHRNGQFQVPLSIYEESYRKHPDHPVVLYVLGYTYLVEGSHASLQKARSLLQRARELRPDLPDVRTALGLTLLKLGQREAGLSELHQALNQDPRFLQALLALARYHQNQHQYSDALTYYQRAVEVHPRSAQVHLEIAETYRALHDYPQALTHVQQALRLEKSGEAYYLLGQLYALLGDAEKAIAAYQRGREYDPDNAEARYRLANIFLDQDKGKFAVLAVRSALAVDPKYRDLADRLKGQGIAQASEVIAQILRERPGNAALQLFLGKLRRKFGDTDAAQKHLELASKLEPQNQDVHVELGKVYEAQNRPDLAEQEYQRAVRLGSAEELPLKRLAERQLAEGDEDAFLETAKRLFAINPKYPELQSAVGRIYQRRSEQAKQAGQALLADKYAALALDHLDMAAKLEPTNAAYKLQLANLYASQNKLKALNVFEDAIALDPGNPEAYYSRAAFMLRYRFGAEHVLLYGLEDVLDDLQKAIELNPNYAQAYSALGLAYERAEQPEEAAKAYEKALKLNPDDLQAHTFLAYWYKAQGKYAEAIRSFRRLMEARPDDVEAIKGFAFLTLSHNEERGWREAQKALRRGLELAPQDAELLMNYGYTLYLEKKYSQAIEYYRRSLKVDPSNARTHYNLALVYELTGQKTLAREEWKQVLDLDSEGRYLDIAIERLADLGGQ